MQQQELSEAEREVYDFVARFIRDRHYAPSVRDIRDGTQRSSTSTVKYTLGLLERRGLIGRDPGISRALWITGRVRTS